MNTKKDKIKFLEAVAAKTVNPEELPSNPIICSRADEMFLGLMTTASQEKEEDQGHVVFIGEAKRELDSFLNGIETR